MNPSKLVALGTLVALTSATSAFAADQKPAAKDHQPPAATAAPAPVDKAATPDKAAPAKKHTKKKHEDQERKS